MSESVIEVKPLEDGKTGIYVDGHLLAQHKYSFACDLFAERLAKLCENVRVEHHPELRGVA